MAAPTKSTTSRSPAWNRSRHAKTVKEGSLPMLRRISLLHAAMISTLVPVGLVGASNTPPTAQSTSSWDEVINTLAYPLDPWVTGPMSKILPAVALIVGGLLLVLAKNEAS